MTLINHSRKLLIPGKGFYYFDFYYYERGRFKITVHYTRNIIFYMQLDSREERWQIVSNKDVKPYPEILAMEQRLDEVIQELLTSAGRGKSPTIYYFD